MGMDKRHADLALAPEPVGSGIVMATDDDTAAGGIVLDDDRAAARTGIVLDDSEAHDRPTPRFGDPMALSFADAQRIHDGDLETCKILGLIDRDQLAALGDAEVQAQIARFTRKLRGLEMRFGDLQKAPGRLLGYRTWREQIVALERAPDAARRLRALIAVEERAVALVDLTKYVEFVLDDKLLEWAEHRKVVRKAESLGLDAADVEAIYHRFEPFEREAQAVAEQAAATGWTPHPKLTTPGEVYAWSFSRLRDALLQRFEVAIEIANQPFDRTYSLYDYLDRNRDNHTEQALRARAAATDAGCPALAVWYFLWTTGPPVLHLGTKDHRPVRTRRRQLASVADLLALVTSDWLIDDLARALEAGLLENWLFVVTRDEALYQLAGKLRHGARGVPDSQRADFLEHAAIRVLWRLGFTGLPLRDDAKRVVIVDDLAQLSTHAEACWDQLAWSLRHGVLAEWLDRFDAPQAERARTCARLATTTDHPAPSGTSGPKKLGRAPAQDHAALSTFLWGAGFRRLRLASGRARDPGDPVVSSLPELFAAMEAPATRAAAREGLDAQLQRGLLEIWLADAIGQPDAATAARNIRGDSRGMKAERWLQRAGMATYHIGNHRADSVVELANLPLTGGDLDLLWEHIREGVPQARFAGHAAVVNILNVVRDATRIPIQHRALVACLQLGLRRLPWRDRVLSMLEDLEMVLLAPGGRDDLRAWLDADVLAAWAESVAPGAGGLVAAARGLDPAIAVDRAVRSVLRPTVYPVEGVGAADFRELADRCRDQIAVLCGDPAARARIRDALLGRVVLPGTPTALHVPTEPELALLAAPFRASMFAWLALGVTTLEVGRETVRSLDEYFAVIATPDGRTQARRMAAAGVISRWYRFALRQPLPDELADKVPPTAFPALCLAMGEAAPHVTVTWSATAAKLPEGARATFTARLINHDPVRIASLVLLAVAAPLQGRLSFARDVVVPPGDAVTTTLEYESPHGVASRVAITVEARHAGPRPLVVHAMQLTVQAGSAWRRLPFAGRASLIGCAIIGCVLLAAAEAKQARSGRSTDAASAPSVMSAPSVTSAPTDPPAPVAPAATATTATHPRAVPPRPTTPVKPKRIASAVAPTPPIGTDAAEAESEYAAGNFTAALSKAEAALAENPAAGRFIAAMAACKLGEHDKAAVHAKLLRGNALARYRAACLATTAPSSAPAPPAAPTAADDDLETP